MNGAQGTVVPSGISWGDEALGAVTKPMSEGVYWGSGTRVGGGTEWARVGGPRTGGNGIWLFHDIGS